MSAAVYGIGHKQPLTLELRVRLDPPFDGARPIAALEANDNSASMWLSLSDDGAHWRASIGSDYSSFVDIEGGLVGDGGWLHLAVMRDADGGLSLYQDGALVGSGGDWGISSGYFTLRIGGWWASSGALDGAVAEARLWAAALGPVTLASWACAEDLGDHVKAGALSGRWVFDAGAGTTITALAGNNATITAADEPSWVEEAPGPGCSATLQCTPETTECDGPAIATCDADGLASLEPCEFGCDVDTAVCWTCSPGSRRCAPSGNVSERCAEDGLAWEYYESCPGMGCHEGSGYCIVCVPNEPYCSPTNPHFSSTCNGSGTSASGSKNCEAIYGTTCDPATGECE